MALNLSTFKTRSITAIIFAVVMLGGLLISGWLFILLCLVILIGAFREFLKLKAIIHPEDTYMKYLHGAVYIIIPIVMYASLGFPSESREDIDFYDPVLPSLILFSIWINDTMAYMTGSWFGKTPFSPISPKKTWEGTIGGAILCIATMTIIAWFYTKMIFWVDMLVISALCAVFGTLGDLYESKLKRMAGVKDSGNILPGHGGMLDRFDSLLFAVPPVWIYVHLFMYK